VAHQEEPDADATGTTHGPISPEADQPSPTASPDDDLDDDPENDPRRAAPVGAASTEGAQS
jgi:hypothetical protein